MNLKNRFAIADCKDIRAKGVLNFLILILCLEKPTHITVTVRNTIFWELLGDRHVDWDLVFHAVVKKLAKNVGKDEATSTCPKYLFHFYKEQ